MPPESLPPGSPDTSSPDTPTLELQARDSHAPDLSEGEALAPTVIVVDDDHGVRTSLELLLKSVGLPVTTYASPQDFLRSYVIEQPGCVIVDVRMPLMSGLELHKELNRRGAMIPIIFTTGNADVTMAVEAMQRGAFDFLTKPVREQTLLERVHRALAKDAANRRVIGQRDRIVQRLGTLTLRERDVLEMVLGGKPNKAMAADLGISQRTIEFYRQRIMEKMQAESLAQLVRMISEISGIPKPPP